MMVAPHAAHRVDAAVDHARRGDGHAAEAARPEIDVAGDRLFAHREREVHHLRGDVVPAARARAEALHDLLERARLEPEPQLA